MESKLKDSLLVVLIIPIIALVFAGVSAYYDWFDHIGEHNSGNNPSSDISDVEPSSDSNSSDGTSSESSYDTNYYNAKLDVPSVGSTFNLGSYKGEAVEWLVLDKKDGRALVISKYGLETIQYNNKKRLVNWNDCTLCYWMNNTFYNEAFSTDEKSYIINGGSVDQKIFALNRSEAEKYFSRGTRKTTATDHAKSQRPYVNSLGYSPWWLRVDGNTQNLVTAVDVDGDINSDYGKNKGGVTDGTVTARPAMWVICN